MTIGDDTTVKGDSQEDLKADDEDSDEADQPFRSKSKYGHANQRGQTKDMGM